ncbi:MAG TPA: hypothetical protein DDZ88_10585 [Verrucomicrobiales bacterium]|nr:hypothetical protein [Verrucomicrobiales bacterium]
MKISDCIRLAAALSLATATPILFFRAGFGAVGVWLLGSLISTALFACVGGRRRVLFTAIAVVPPFVVVTADNFRFFSKFRPSSEAFLETLSIASPGFGFFVALPLLIVFVTSRVTRKTRNT